MEEVSDRFLREIRTSHTVYSYVDLIGSNQEVIRLKATGGDVQVDRTAAVRRRCSGTCVDPTGELTPEEAGAVLTPYGTELRPYRGVRYADGEIEVIPLGVFRLAKVSITDSSQGVPQIALEAYDLSRTVARDKFTAPYVLAEGTNVIDGIKEILGRTFPNLSYDSISTHIELSAPSLYDAGADPWEAVTVLASSLGCEIFFNTRGWVVIAPPADIDSLPSPDFTYIEGQGSTLLSLDRVFTDEPGFNGVIVTGESPGDELPPVRGEAWDEEPSSATYRLGPYGEVPMFVTDQVIKTVDDAEAAAEALLRGQLGFSSQLSLTASTNPALDAGDTIEVTRVRTKVSGLFSVDALNVPLAAGGSQSLTLRQKRRVG